MIEQNWQSILETKIRNHLAIVGVVGLGYVGLPFAVEKAKVGFSVIGIEQNPERVNKIQHGINYIDDVDDTELAELVKSGKLEVTDSFDRIAEMDAIVICVPTPLTKNLTPDLSYVQSVTDKLALHLRPGQLISLESTTYPGTTDEVIRPILEEYSGLKQGQHFFLAHSPERVDPGNQRYTTKNTSKVVGASDQNSLTVAILFYEQTIQHVVGVSSAKAAELVKVFENTFRAVNIALVNELALLCDRMEIDVWEVLDAANTKPFGIMPFYPGPGVGGHCIPLDPHYLEWKAKEFNFETHFIALAGEINRRMPEFVCTKIWRILNRLGVAASVSKILIVGVAYKKNLSDCRESPAIVIFRELVRHGATVIYHDPWVPHLAEVGLESASLELTPAQVAEVDLVVVVTDHDDIDYSMLVEHSPAILDTRGVTRRMKVDRTKVSLL